MRTSASELPGVRLASYRPACGLCYLSSLTANLHARQPHRVDSNQNLQQSLQHIYYSSMKRPRIQQSAESDYDLELVFCIINAGRAMEQRLEAALAEIGLSLAKFGALTHLVEAGEPLSLSECAKRMTCVRSNITQLMDRLEVDGLVRRVNDPEDRRAVLAELTSLGAERQTAGAEVVAKVQTALTKELKGTNLSELRRALAAVR
jgi:DNA-binding MarR family transcriptional regulator